MIESMKVCGYDLKIHVESEAESTQLLAKELPKNALKEGTVIVAERQTQGRGSGKRSWHSPNGGLYVTAVLRPSEKSPPTEMAFLGGTAMAQTVETLLPKTNMISVKWPNDCLVGWKKVGGILSETTHVPSGRLCLLGFGLNVNVSQEELGKIEKRAFEPTSFMAETAGSEYELPRVLEVLLTKTFQLYDLYKTEGWEAIRFLWEKKCRLLGKRLEFTQDLGQGKTEKTTGHVLGIDEKGALVISTPEGERKTFHHGEITCFWP